MKLRYRFLIFTLTLMILTVPVYARGKLSVKQDSTSEKLYQKIDPPNSKPVYSIAFATSTEKPTYILGQQNYFLLTTSDRQHQKIRLPYLYRGSTVVSAAFSRSLKYTLALSAAKAKLLLLYDSLEDKVPTIFEINSTSTVNAVTYSPDSSMFAVGTTRDVSIRNAKDGNPFINQINIPGFIQSLVFSPSSRMLAVGRTHGTIELWDVFEHTHLKSLNPKPGYGTKALAFSPNGEMLAVGRVNTGQIELWNVLSEQMQGSFTNEHQGTVHSVAFSPNGKTLASGGADGKVLLWDIQTQAKIDPIQHFKQKHPKFNGAGHGGNAQVLSVAFSDDGKTLMSGDATGLVLLWDLSAIDIDTGPSLVSLTAANAPPGDSKASSQTASGKTQAKQEPEITATAEKADKIAPEIIVDSKRNVASGKKVVLISGTVKGDRNAIQSVAINNKEIGIALEESFTYRFTTTVRLEEEGDNTFTITATDKVGSTESKTVKIHREPSPPKIQVISPRFTETKHAQVDIVVKVTDESGIAEVKANNKPLRRMSTVSGGALYKGIGTLAPRGSTVFIVTARDTKGSAEAEKRIEITALTDETPVDETPPTIVISEKETQKKVREGDTYVAYISGTITDAENGIASSKIGDVEIPLNSVGHFQHRVLLNEGNNTFTIVATDRAGKTTSETVKIHREPTPPNITVEHPILDTNGSVEIRQAEFEVRVKVTDESDIAEVICGGWRMSRDETVSGGGIYITPISDLAPGSHTLKIIAKDIHGSEATRKITIISASVADKTKPTIVLDPRTGDVSAAQTYISGTITDADSGIERVQISGVQIEDMEIPLDPTGDFQHNVPLNEGDNIFTVTATDEANNSDFKTVKIYRTPIGPHIEVVNPPRDRNKVAQISTDSFTVEVEVTDESGIKHVKINGTKVLPKDDGKTFSTTLYRSSVSGRVTIEATDWVDESSRESFTVNFQRSQPPIAPTPSADKTDNVNRRTTTSSPTTLNEEEDPPVIQFTKAELIRAQSLKTSDDRFHLIINVADESGIKLVKIDRYATGETFEASETGTEGIYEADLPLNVGKNMFHITAVDSVPTPNVGTADFEIVKLPTDTEGPTIESLEADNTPIRSDGVSVTVKQQGIYIHGRVTDDKSDVDSVYVNREKVPVNPNGSFQTYITLNNARNSIVVTATDTVGNPSTRTFTIHRQVDREGPTITINRVGNQTVGPINDSITVTEDSIDIWGSVTDHESGVNFSSVEVNGEPVQVQRDRSFRAHIFLDDEKNPIVVKATDTVGNPSTRTFTIYRQRDREGPTINLRRIGTHTIHSTDETITVTEEEVVIRGSVKDPSDVYRVEINKENVPVDANGIFEKKLSLNYGKNPIVVEATDTVGNPSTRTFKITQQFDRRGKDFALFFPTNTYSGAKDRMGNWQNLGSPIEEAEEISESLRINYGFETEVFKDLTKRELLNTLYAYKDTFEGTEYAEDSQLLIFLSGHGYYDQEQKAGYLITADTDVPSVDPTFESALSHRKLRDQIDLITCPRILVLLDTCYSGTFDPDFKPPDIEMKDFLDGLSLLKQIQATLRLEARWCLTAAGVEKVASGKGTETGRSPFAEAFLNALNTNGGEDFVLKLDEVWQEIEGSKSNPIYETIIEQEKKKGKDFDPPVPRKARFGKKSILPESDFLFFPKIE